MRNKSNKFIQTIRDYEKLLAVVDISFLHKLSFNIYINETSSGNIGKHIFGEF